MKNFLLLIAISFFYFTSYAQEIKKIEILKSNEIEITFSENFSSDPSFSIFAWIDNNIELNYFLDFQMKEKNCITISFEEDIKTEEEIINFNFYSSQTGVVRKEF